MFLQRSPIFSSFGAYEDILVSSVRVVVQCTSNMADENSPIAENSQSAKKYKSNNWVHQQEFATDGDKDAFFIANKNWKIYNSRTNEYGEKNTRFYCNVVRRTKERSCPAQLSLIHYHDGKQILYTNGLEHVHDQDDQCKTRSPASPFVREKVKNLAHMKPRMIFANMQNDADVPNEHKPTYNQVNEAISRN